MSIADILGSVGNGLATGARVVGAVAGPVLERTGEVLSGEAPQIDQENRRQQMELQDAALNAKADELEAQLQMGRKYGTLTPQQQGQLAQAIPAIFTQAGRHDSLMTRFMRSTHPGGATYQPNTPNQPSANATPQGGTAYADITNAMQLAGLKAKPHYQNFRIPDGRTVTIDVNHQVPDPSWVATGTSTGYIRQGSHVINPSDADKLIGTGMAKFPKQDGSNWTAKEVENFPPGVVLAQFIQGDQTFYAPVDQRTKTATWGNMVHQINEAGEIDSDNATPLGQQRTGSVTTQTAPGGGQVITQTNTPRTMGTTLQQPPAPSTGAKPVSPPSPGSVMRKVHSVHPQSILPNIQAMTPRNAALAQKTQPAVSALLGIYGDPQNPSVPSLMDYAKLASDPHAQKVLGEAFKLLDQQMGEISDPGIIQTLGTAAGWANFRAQSESGAQQATGTQMTREERDYFDSAIASMADIIGARSATGQSPARFSVRAMQNELPLIGLSGTQDENAYLTKLETIGRQVGVGLNAMPDNSRALAWLSKREKEIAQQKQNIRGGGVSGAMNAGSKGKRIRVKLSDGRTGTIDASQFDSSTMTKVQ